MIYGRINVNNTEGLMAQLHNLKQLMVWPYSIHKEIEYGFVFGGIIYDSRLPYKLEDFYYLEKQKELMILMSGAIYNRDKIKEKLLLAHSNIPDPELAMFAFIKWGEKFVEKLNGDFSILIYAKKNQHCSPIP